MRAQELLTEAPISTTSETPLTSSGVPTVSDGEIRPGFHGRERERTIRLFGGAFQKGRVRAKPSNQEAQLLRNEIAQRITKQAPGGEALAPPSPLTLAAREMKGRGGTKALLVKGVLRNSVAAIVKGDEAFIGVPRKARAQGGKALVDVAQVQEFGKGPIIVPMTPAMRRFLFALLRKAGQEPKGDSGKGVVIINVPARPFLRPAFKKFSLCAQRNLGQTVNHGPRSTKNNGAFYRAAFDRVKRSFEHLRRVILSPFHDLSHRQQIASDVKMRKAVMHLEKTPLARRQLLAERLPLLTVVCHPSMPLSGVVGMRMASSYRGGRATAALLPPFAAPAGSCRAPFGSRPSRSVP